ncbi:MAG: hypothetical protein WC108_04695 [Bacteroidales bacterium]|jgi:hypothetical protein|nr:hypothetical protein [Bacteroidales bacterium]MDD4002063.1 hypothetical protein [Bacteroidales bacterium]MDD4528726.1 hypothetical protein [Bacteroidales bacterium]MDD4829349.1 hypothetical protein [Bacteroidales bacterium]
MECNEIGALIQKKTELNNLVADNTHKAFGIFKETAKEINSELNKNYPIINCKFENRGDFEFKLSFGSDTLVFLQHSNIFEFPRLHEVMKIPYIKEDKSRSYCGMINIYNFLTDSFDYNRDLDIGYLIGRIFINKDNHYFIEGKREIGLLYTSFHKALINKDSILNIIKSSMEYVNNFDLLTPPFDEVKFSTVGEIKSNQSIKKQITGKRLGFDFKQDKE